MSAKQQVMTMIFGGHLGMVEIAFDDPSHYDEVEAFIYQETHFDVVIKNTTNKVTKQIPLEEIVRMEEVDTQVFCITYPTYQIFLRSKKKRVKTTA